MMPCAMAACTEQHRQATVSHALHTGHMAQTAGEKHFQEVTTVLLADFI